MPSHCNTKVYLKQQGFNLLELLVVLVIVLILATVGYPQYQKYVKQSRVSDGRDKLLEVASQLERCYSRDDSYQACDEEILPLKDSEQGYYQLAFDEVSATTYTLLATAKIQSQVTCNSLWIKHTGEKGGENNACW